MFYIAVINEKYCFAGLYFNVPSVGVLLWALDVLYRCTIVAGVELIKRVLVSMRCDILFHMPFFGTREPVRC